MFFLSLEEILFFYCRKQIVDRFATGLSLHCSFDRVSFEKALPSCFFIANARYWPMLGLEFSIVEIATSSYSCQIQLEMKILK